MSQQSPSTSPFASRSRLAAASPAPSNGLISIEVTDAPEKAGETRPRRHPLVAGGSLVTGWSEQIITLYDYFQESIRLYGNKFVYFYHSGERPCFGVRSGAGKAAGPYEWTSYAEIGKRIRNLAAGLTMFKLNELDNVGLFSINRPEWVWQGE